MNSSEMLFDWFFQSNQSDKIYDYLIETLAVSNKGYNPWIGSFIGSVLVGLSGVFPLIVIPIDGSVDFNEGVGSERLKLLLSFAVGGLLGDVFIHLLPEAWSNHFNGTSEETPQAYIGIWILTGLLLFTVVEKILSSTKTSFAEIENEATDISNNNNNLEKTKNEKSSSKHISGYLNLMANVLDNYTHGLAVGGSFLLSGWQGALTTSAILIHEIPHEVGDFAILLRSGFSRLEAAKAQLATASSSMFGAFTAIYFSGSYDSIHTHTSWILPFTVGGFLNIALVTVLPELLQEKSPKESVKQLLCLIAGIVVMAALSFIPE